MGIKRGLKQPHIRDSTTTMRRLCAGLSRASKNLHTCEGHNGFGKCLALNEEVDDVDGTAIIAISITDPENGRTIALTKIVDEETGELVNEFSRTFDDTKREIVRRLVIDDAIDRIRELGFMNVLIETAGGYLLSVKDL